MRIDPGRTGHTCESGPQTQPVEHWAHALPTWFPTAPALAGDLLLAATWNGALQALDRHTGALIWENPAPARWATEDDEELDELVVEAPAVDGGQAYIAVEDSLRAVNLQTGATVWEKTWQDPEASGPPAAVDGILLVTGSSELTRLDPADGATHWSAQLPSPVPLLTTAATFGHGMAYLAAGFEPHHVHGGLHIVDLTTGAIRTSLDDFPDASVGPAYFYPSHPVVADGTLWMLAQGESGGPEAMALDPATGSLMRRILVGKDQDVLLTAPALADGTMLVVDIGEMHALETESGQSRWRTPAAGTLGPPLATDNAVYRVTADGIVHCHRIDSGELLWSYTTGASISSRATDDTDDGDSYCENPSLLTVADGVLYVRTDEAIHALGPR